MEQSKIGYSFSKINGEFISEEIVYLEKATGTYPCADNVTFITPPPVQEHEKQVWDGQNWNIVADFRGEAYYDIDGSQIGIITELGVDSTDVIMKEPPEVDQYHKLFWNGSDWDIVLKEGYVIGEDGEPRNMTQAERIVAGLEELSEDMKIVNGEVVIKTRDELFAEGRLTVEEYNEEVDAERESRFRSETDKMGLMYLRGECTLEEWKSAMDKIREELPKK